MNEHKGFRYKKRGKQIKSKQDSIIGHRSQPLQFTDANQWVKHLKVLVFLSQQRRFQMSQASDRFGLASQLIHTGRCSSNKPEKNKQTWRSVFISASIHCDPNSKCTKKREIAKLHLCTATYKMYGTESWPELVPPFLAFSNASGERPISYCSNE